MVSAVKAVSAPVVSHAPAVSQPLAHAPAAKPAVFTGAAPAHAGGRLKVSA